MLINKSIQLKRVTVTLFETIFNALLRPHQAKSQALVEKYAAVSQLNSERCLQLERAQSLAGQFWETYEELCPWLQDTLAAFSQLHLPAIEYETLRQQQEELRVSATPFTTDHTLTFCL